MPYLHVSASEGKTLLAVIAEEPILNDGHHVVLDVDIVESRSEARDWFSRHCKGKTNGGESPLQCGTHGQERSDGVW